MTVVMQKKDEQKKDEQKKDEVEGGIYKPKYPGNPDHPAMHAALSARMMQHLEAAPRGASLSARMMLCHCNSRS